MIINTASTDPAGRNDLVFDVNEIRVSIEIPNDAFVALLDSESYVTDHACYKNGNQPLSEKLEMAANITDVEYNGHFGNYVFFSVDPEAYTPELRDRIVFVIDEHLEWAMSL